MYAFKIFAILLSVTIAMGRVISLDISSAEMADTVIRSPQHDDVDGAIIVGREPRVVNPDAITGTTCTSRGTAIGDHNINVALLAICGGIAGKIEQCRGAPTSTTGASGDAKFKLSAQTKGQTINISKGRWEGCVAAARAACGDSPFKTTCIGGANGNKGNVNFSLEKQ